MNNHVLNFFIDLENKCLSLDGRNYLLWPTTEINEQIQEWIVDRYGVEDNIIHDGSRPNVIYNAIKSLISGGDIGEDFSILDICCGDALILSQLRDRFRNCNAIGFDINKGKFDSHKEAESRGVKLYYGFIQELFLTNLPHKVDIIVMLNTFRSWHTARLRKEDEKLPSLSQEWLTKNARYLMLTVNEQQLSFFRSNYTVTYFGKGEEKSHFIMVRC